jgi:hypothetical protein
MKITVQKFLASAATLAALALPQVALGQTGSLSMSGYAYPTALNFGVTGHSNVGAGGFNASYDANFAAPPAPTSFVAYCVDLAQTFSFGSPFSVTATNPASMSAIGGVRASALDRLYTQHFAAADTRTESAAFQLSVWEILQEAPTTVFGINALGAGSFRATAATSGTTLDSDAITMANSWLSTLSGASGAYTLTVLASPTRQDQMMATPIPEPETYMMLLAGLGLMGFVARRRQRSLAA